MKVFDVFSFSEPYEKEILLLKFQLADPLVHQWILVENDYALQGTYKGYFAESTLKDDRFNPFRDKVKIIQTSFMPDVKKLTDEIAFEVEFHQRDVALTYIIQNCDLSDYVIVSDVDECTDFTDSKRVNEFLGKLKKQPDILELSTRRYWFDFDNAYKIVLSTPAVKVNCLHQGASLSAIRKKYRRPCREHWKNFMVFEYSHCFPKEQILRKLLTFAHTGFTEQDLNRALENNHRVLRSSGDEHLKLNDRYIFERVKLTPRNSPAIVRENIESLKVNLIPAQYKANRKINYPDLFSPHNIIAQKIRRWLKQILLFGRVS